MAELTQLDGEAGCSVCDQSRARRQSAAGHSTAKKCVFSVTQTPSSRKMLESPSGVHREQREDLYA